MSGSDRLRRMAAGRDPFETEQDDSYHAWRGSSQGMVRDLVFVPAPGSGEPRRAESLLQAISWELSEDGDKLCLMFHTSGQIAIIEGRGLDALAEQISAKRVQSLHEWHESTHGPAPDDVITAMRFDKTFSRLGE